MFPLLQPLLLAEYPLIFLFSVNITQFFFSDFLILFFIIMIVILVIYSLLTLFFKSPIKGSITLTVLLIFLLYLPPFFDYFGGFKLMGIRIIRIRYFGPLFIFFFVYFVLKIYRKKVSSFYSYILVFPLVLLIFFI